MTLAMLSGFQIVTLFVVALLFVGSLWALAKGWAGRRESLIWAAVWLAAGVAVLWPSITEKIANTLNIGRGADLVLYCAVLVMLAGFWAIYIRLRRVRRDVTLLVRHIAIQEAELRKAAGLDPQTPSMLDEKSPPAEKGDTPTASQQADQRRP